MADLFPDSGLFDELEFLRFSDEQFASEVVLPEASDAQETSLFTAALAEAYVSGTEELDGCSMMHSLAELKSVVASCTVGIYRSPESDESDAALVGCEEKTLNEIITVASDRDPCRRKLSWSVSNTEEADVTSPVSFSAVSEMSPVEASPKLIQSSEVSQTRPSVADVSSGEQTRKRKLKVCRTPGSIKPQTHTYSKLDAVEFGRKAMKRKRSVTGEEAAETTQFKNTKKTKKYMERPYADPDMERTRLNAINAKKNRDQKKQMFQTLNEKCDNLSQENGELDRTNKSLEARLQAAEEEIAFLRSALLGRVGRAKPALADTLKSLSGGDSAPAG